MTATRTSPQSEPITPPDAQGLRADLFRQTPMGQVDRAIPNLIAGAAEFPVDVVTHPIEAAQRAITAPYRAVQAAVPFGAAVRRSIFSGPESPLPNNANRPGTFAKGAALSEATFPPEFPGVAETGEKLLGPVTDVAALTAPLLNKGGGAIADALQAREIARGRAAGTPIHMGEFQDVFTRPVETQKEAIARREARQTAIDTRASGPQAAFPGEVGGEPPADFRDAPWRSAEAPPPQPLVATGAEERGAGASIPKQVREAVSTATTQAFTNPYAPIATEHPALSNALQSAGAMTTGKAESFGRQLASRVVKDLTPDQREQFETARVAANLESEAQRKTAGAEATAKQAVQHRMEVRQLAKQDLDRENAKADAIEEVGRQRAATLAQQAPPPAPMDPMLDMDPATRVARQKAVADHAGRVQEALDAAKMDADEIRKPAQQDYDLAIKKGDEGHDALQTDAAAKRHAAERATAEAVELRKKVPVGVASQPWFQQALQRHMQMVEPFGETAALRTGVEEGALRRSPLGYARLTPQEIINERLIQKTQETAAAGKSTTPRTGIKLKLLGQKPSVNPLLPAGGEAPLQGPVNTLKPEGAVAAPTAATKETGSAKEFRGAAPKFAAGTPPEEEGEAKEERERIPAYSTDYVTNVARDLSDKVPKMAKNQVYQALASESMRTGSKIRKLVPTENPAPGERLLAFNDQKDIIQPPAKDDPNYQTVQRFAVPEDVADAFARYQSREGPSSNLGKGAQKANQFLMRSVLSNPLVAAGHSLTEASNVSRGLPAGAGVTKTIATGLPLLKSADVLRRAAGVDLTAPENTARLHRLALSGALRIGDERGQGWVDAAHSALFGPNGLDTRMRLVASEDAEAAWTKAGGSLKDPAFTAFERDYVTGHSGNYVGKNQGTAIQALNQSGLTPFIAIGRAKLGGSLQAITGGGGPPGEGLGQRLLRVQRGPVGQAAAITGAGYLLSGHAPTKNAPGHETDLATGVYHVADGSYHYFRGDPDEAVQTLGQGAKEVYLRKGFMDPSSAAALRLLEPIAYAKPGDKVSESVRAAANTALAFAGPAPSLGTQLATGHELYFDKDGALGSVQGIHLSKDADLTDRLVGAARNLNAGVAIGMAPATPGGRSAASAALGNLNPVTEATAGTAPRTATDRARLTKVLQDAWSKVHAEQDPAKRSALIDETRKTLEDAGLSNDRQVILGIRDLYKAARQSRPKQPLAPQGAPPPSEEPLAMAGSQGNQNGSVVFHYDDQGRISGASGGKRRVVFAYDGDGRLTGGTLH